MTGAEPRFCPRCGTDRVADMPFCPNCGLNIGDLRGGAAIEGADAHPAGAIEGADVQPSVAIDNASSQPSASSPDAQPLSESPEAWPLAESPEARPLSESPEARPWAAERTVGERAVGEPTARERLARLPGVVIAGGLVMIGLIVFGLLFLLRPAGNVGSGSQSGPNTSLAASAPIVGLTILSPKDGQAVATKEVTVVGIAPPGLKITQDISFGLDQHANVDGTGHWAIKVDLNEGDNKLTFRIGDDASTRQTIRVIYTPPQTP